MLTKRKIIYALISISLLLIVCNIILEKFYYEDDIAIVQELSKKIIEEKFISTLIDYGIIDDWISQATSKKNKSDSLEYYYKIKFPSKISIASFIMPAFGLRQSQSTLYKSKQM